MSYFIVNAPFKFDSDTTKDACLAALGASAAFEVDTDSSTGAVTLDSTYANKLTLFTGNSTINLTLDTDSSGGFVDDQVIHLAQYGTGVVNVEPETGVTLNASSGATTRTQYSVITLHRVGANEWILYGDVVVDDSLSGGGEW